MIGRQLKLQYFKDYAFSREHYNDFEIKEQIRASDDTNYTDGYCGTLLAVIIVVV
ncbi:MAG: hypothetical protein V3S80_06565 [Sulfurimonadaceae bacterium]